MVEFIRLLQESVPESLKWIVHLIVYFSIFCVIVERVYSFISKESTERRIRKTENQKLCQELIGNNSSLGDFNSEVNCFEAFYLITGIRASNQRREKLLSLVKLGFLNYTQLKDIDQFTEMLDGDRYKIQLGVSEFWSVGFGFLGILFVSVAMMTIHFLLSKNDGIIALYSMLIGTSLIFMIAFSVKNDVRRISLVLKSCKELRKRDILEGEDNFKGQFYAAFRNERMSVIIVITFSLLLMAFSWFLAYLIKG